MCGSASLAIVAIFLTLAVSCQQKEPTPNANGIPANAPQDVTKHRSRGTFDVTPTPQADPKDVGDPTIGRTALEKKFHGDLKAESKGQMLGVRTATKGSAGYVAMEHVVGELAGRTGTFVLQHSGIMRRGEFQQNIIVVPDSGTEKLLGLRGTMTIEIVDGKHFYNLEYWFEPASGDDSKSEPKGK